MTEKLRSANDALLFYVQDVQYNAVTWMWESVYAQDVRYNAVTWSFFAIHGITTLMCPYMSMHKSAYVQAPLIYPEFRGISVSR